MNIYDEYYDLKRTPHTHKHPRTFTRILQDTTLHIRAIHQQELHEERQPQQQQQKQTKNQKNLLTLYISYEIYVY